MIARFALPLLVFLNACAGSPKPFNEEHFKANKKEYLDSYVDVSGGGVLDDSKKVIIPDFKVYFQTEAKGKSESGHFLSKSTARVSGKLRLAVDPKILQELTDKAYAQFVSDLKELGYEVIEPKKLAELFPEYKKYIEGDSMKPSPQNLDNQYIAYAPTGMKLETPGLEIGYNTASGVVSAFRTNLLDVGARATKELDAIRIQPLFIISFGNFEASSSAMSASIEAKQALSVLPGSQYRFAQNWSSGNILLEKPVFSDHEFGKIIEATTAGDTTRGFFSALSYAMGGSQNESNTWLVEANGDKFRDISWQLIKASQEIFRDRMKEEL